MQRDIGEVLMGCDCVTYYHRLIIHDYGYRNKYATAHIVLDADNSLTDDALAADSICNKILKDFNIEMTAQIEVKRQGVGFTPKA